MNSEGCRLGSGDVVVHQDARYPVRGKHKKPR